MSDLSLSVRACRTVYNKQAVEFRENCPICLETVVKAHKTKCGHIFCESCITEWYNHSNQCPLCRSSINSPNGNKYTVTVPEINYSDNIYVFAVNYNILRVMDGMASLRYTN
jgi:hypothetical protein